MGGTAGPVQEWPLSHPAHLGIQDSVVEIILKLESLL